MITSNVYKFLTDKEHQIKEDLLELVRADSPSNNLELLAKCEKVIQDIMESHFGNLFTLEKFTNSQHGTHLKFELAKETNNPKVLFLSHYDTVWNEGTLEIVENGDQIFGPGIFDMKAGLTASIWAVKSLLHTENELPIAPIFMFTADEELGSPTSRQIIEDVAKRCDAVFVMEPPAGSQYALKTERKGVGMFNITAKGISSHAGSHHEHGVSAIVEMAKVILKLETLTDYSKGTTINIGTIEGGTKRNVVPESSSILVDFRVKTKEEADRVETFINSLKPENTKVELIIEGGLNRPPMEKNEQNMKLFELARKAGKKLEMDVQEASVGGGSDGNFTSAIGIPTLDGLGIPGAGPHARHEHIHFNLFMQKCALIAETSLLLSKNKIHS